MGGEVKGKLANGVGSQYFTLPRNTVMLTPRLPVGDWTEAPADLNGLLRFAEGPNLVSARVPSHFKRSLPTCVNRMANDCRTMWRGKRNTYRKICGSSIFRISFQDLSTVRCNIYYKPKVLILITSLHKTKTNKLKQIYRVSQEERTKLREGVPYVKLYRHNPKHLYPKLNGYGDNGQRKVWTSCISSYCTSTAV